MSAKTEYEKVLEFYEKFKQENHIAKVSSLDESVITNERAIMKMDLIAEEFIELCEAFFGETSGKILQEAYTIAKEKDEKNRDIVEVADALTDLRYVIYGLEIESGIPSAQIFNEVHSSNMSKLDAQGEPIISDGSTAPLGKILKGENYFKPDIKKIIDNN